MRRELTYVELRRIENAIVRLARDRGIDGDPFAETVPSLGTCEEEWTITCLVLDIRPRPSCDEARELVKRLARAVVMTRSERLQPRISYTLQEATLDYIEQLAGRPVPEKRVRWVPDRLPPRSTPAAPRKRGRRLA